MLAPIVSVICTVIYVVQVLVVIDALLSWFRLAPDHPLRKLVRIVVGPLLMLARPLARLIPGSLDWSGAIVLLALQVLKDLLQRLA